MSGIINKLTKNPRILTFFRRISEFNFTGMKKLLKNELSSLNENARILDLGCGMGIWSVFFKKYDYYGVDVEPDYINFAKMNYKGNFELMNASKMTFPDNFFDLVMVYGVFHHVNDKKSLEILDEIKRVSKKGGRILIIESMNIESRYDIFGNLIRKLDRGSHIRKEEEYINLFSQKFKLGRKYPIKTGFTTCQVFVI